MDNWYSILNDTATASIAFKLSDVRSFAETREDSDDFGLIVMTEAGRLQLGFKEGPALTVAFTNLLDVLQRWEASRE